MVRVLELLIIVVHVVLAAERVLVSSARRRPAFVAPHQERSHRDDGAIIRPSRAGDCGRSAPCGGPHGADSLSRYAEEGPRHSYGRSGLYRVAPDCPMTCVVHSP